MAATLSVTVVLVTVLVALLDVPSGGGGLLGRAWADEQHKIGGKQHWSPGVNYTAWAERERFYLNDWLVFEYQKGMYDVLQVNETAYNHCINTDPIRNESKGRSYVVQLNRTGMWYFICSKGYCWGGMKLAIQVESLPPPALATETSLPSAGPATAPEPSSSSASGSVRPWNPSHIQNVNRVLILGMPTRAGVACLTTREGFARLLLYSLFLGAVEWLGLLGQVGWAGLCVLLVWNFLAGLVDDRRD